MNDQNHTELIKRNLNSKYGFTLNLVNRNKTDNFPHHLYRVRFVNKNEEITNSGQLSYPKLKSSLGRCNFANEPVFYCSDKSTTAIAETLKYQNPNDMHLYLSVWKFIPGNSLNIFPFLEKAKQKNLQVNIDRTYIISDTKNRIKVKKQLLQMEKYFYDENHELSASLCNLLFNSSILPCDCIFYPSAIANETGINISIKPEYFDQHVKFQRAYKFEISGSKGDYNVRPLKYTLGQPDNFIWRKSTIDDMLFNALTAEDLHIPYK